MNDAINLVTKEQAVYVPTKCPCCGADLIWNGVHLQCPNLECADADVQDTLIWMKHIAPWDGLGDTLKLTYLEELFGENITIEKIYERGPFSDNYIQTSYVKKTEFRKMFNALFTNPVKLADAIQALNIPRLGDVTSRKLAQRPQVVINAMNSCLHDDDPAFLGTANAQSMWAHVKKFERLKYIKNQIIWEEEAIGDKGKVAITGKLSVKRSVLEDELRSYGYTPGEISKDTAYLIIDDISSTSSKAKFARTHNIQMISEAEFRSKFLS